MKIDNHLLLDLQNAVKSCGGAGKFAAACKVSASNISRYLNGKVHTISDDNWSKISAFLSPVQPIAPLAPENIFAGAVPLADWENDLSGEPGSIPEFFKDDFPTGSRQFVPYVSEPRQKLRAIRVRKVKMAPTLLDDDIILAEAIDPAGEMPYNHVVIAVVESRGRLLALCRRLRRLPDGMLLFCSDEPGGAIHAAGRNDVKFIAVVTQKTGKL